MKCNLDLAKAQNLRSLINKDHYCYMYDLENYYEICTIMDRLEDTVYLLSSFELPEKKDQFNATDFISWVNYADLIINCIMRLNDIFIKPTKTTFFHDDNIRICNQFRKPYSSKYLGKYYTNDNDDNFFKFIRSMVLAHSLKIDCNKFNAFTHNNFVYTPLVRWDDCEKDLVEITYYIPDYKIKTQTLKIEIKDIFEYLESRYNYLDLIFPYIEKAKDVEKEKFQNLYTEDFKILPADIHQKIKYIKEIYYKNGDIDVKNKATILWGYLDLIETIIETKFNDINKDKINLMFEIIDICMNNIVECLKNQENDEMLVSDIFIQHMYPDNYGKFMSGTYDINKIYEDYVYMMKDSNYFYNHYNKVAKGVECYFRINSNIDDKEKVLLSIIALGMDNLLHKDELLNKFPKDIKKKVEKIYEIQI